MLPYHEKAKSNAEEYARRTRCPLNECLGFGFDGIVFSTISDTPGTTETAIKALRYEALYKRELTAYLQLQHFDVRKICGFEVPTLLNYDDDLWIVEMGVVSPPCILDFAGSFDELHPDYQEFPEYTEETRDSFGSRWGKVQEILSEFRRYGICLLDVRPSNIIFGEDWPSQTP